MSIFPYEFLRDILFRLEAEHAHDAALCAMKLAERFHLSGLYRNTTLSAGPTHAMGLAFSNPVGLAAGLDKNGDYIDALGDLGFGFVEIGTVTPRPQPGNPKPRLFRLPEHGAIINRMGFNNKGVDYLISNVKKRRYKGILGINIGKNFDTPVENAASDYLSGIEKVYPYADYIVVNFSSPNTPGLRSLQLGELLEKLVEALALKCQLMEKVHGKRVPLVLKIAPDISNAELCHLMTTALNHGVSGIIATNTTTSREGVESSSDANESGGLSGRPLFERSTAVLSELARLVEGRMTLIGTGGINDVNSAIRKFDAGADLIQIYTGFIYQGPGLISDICSHLDLRRKIAHPK